MHTENTVTQFRKYKGAARIALLFSQVLQFRSCPNPCPLLMHWMTPIKPTWSSLPHLYQLFPGFLLLPPWCSALIISMRSRSDRSLRPLLTCEPGSNDWESNALDIMLAERILNGSSYISTTWYSTQIHDWTLQATDALNAPGGRLPREEEIPCRKQRNQHRPVENFATGGFKVMEDLVWIFKPFDMQYRRLSGVADLVSCKIQSRIWTLYRAITRLSLKLVVKSMRYW